MVLGLAHRLGPVHKQFKVTVFWNRQLVKQVFPSFDVALIKLNRGHVARHRRGIFTCVVGCAVVGTDVGECGFRVSEAETSHLEVLGLRDGPA